MTSALLGDRQRLWRVSAHVLAWLPVLYLAFRWWDDGFGVNPVETVTRITGRSALALLVLTLACTPAKLVGLRRAVTVRRALGLYAFLYAFVHLLALVGLDYGFDWAFIREDALVSKPYVVVGLVSLLIMLPLAATSNRAAMKQLGRNWTRLHRFVYLAAVLAVVHYVWVVKAVTAGPVLVAIVLAILLVVRLPRIRQGLSRLRQAQR